MSKQLVVKALNLLSEDLKTEKPKSKKVKNKTVLSTNKYGIQKQKKKLQKLAEQKRKNRAVLEQKMKSSIEDYKEKFLVDRTEENVQILQLLRQLKPKSSAAQKIIDFHYKQQARQLFEPEAEEPVSESILFPVEDKKKKKKK
ncbi:hypothetical protein X975_25141, partial [Stegodyphus mimosarum]